MSASAPPPVPGPKIVVRADPDLRDLIPEYLEDRRRELPPLDAALSKGDFETIRGVGHRLRGTGGGYGFDELTTIGASLEKAAKERHVETVRRDLARLAAYLGSVEVVYG